MESDEAASEQVDEQSGATGSSPVRSYECTFCKRGFSNAQALGGHMNIHRRDKARLKQASSTCSSSPMDQNQQSLDINFPSSYNISPNHPDMNANRTSGKWPWVVQDDADKRSDKSSQHVGEIKQLPLFDEKPSTTDESCTGQVEEKGFRSSGSDRLDLELRLGPEPKDSSPTITTKKFF